MSSAKNFTRFCGVFMNLKQKRLLRVVKKEKMPISPGRMASITRTLEDAEDCLYWLRAHGYIETIGQKQPANLAGHPYEVDFFSLTEKGYLYFAPLHKKLWMAGKRDLKTILISVVTSVVTFVIIYLLEKLTER